MSFEFKLPSMFSEGEDQYGNYKELKPCEQNKPFLLSDVSFRFRKIPAGEFVMGAGAVNEPLRAKVFPKTVKVHRPFWVSDTPVTIQQFKTVVEDFYFSEGEELLPATGVTYFDAIKFCCELSQKTNSFIRLPYEYEWEYACRGGSESQFYYGDECDTSQTLCNRLKIFEDLRDSLQYAIDGNATTRDSVENVKNSSPNKYGLFSLSGNVWEWCNDGYDYKNVDLNKDAITPTYTVEDENFVVCKGGSFRSDPEECTSWFRAVNSPHYKGYNVGFRLLML